MNEAKVRLLISEMIRLLTTYEIELTTYETVYEAVKSRLVDAGIDIDLRKMLRLVSGSTSLQAEAEAEYAALLGVIKAMTPESIDGALASIKQTIDHRDNQRNWVVSRHLLQKSGTGNVNGDELGESSFGLFAQLSHAILFWRIPTPEVHGG
jgi:hypothetical protein